MDSCVKIALLFSLLFLCIQMQAKQDKYINEVVLTASTLERIPEEINILPYPSLARSTEPQKPSIQETPGLTITGMREVAENSKWQPHIEFRFKLANPVLINAAARPRLLIEREGGIREIFGAEEINAAGVHNILFINADKNDEGMKIEPLTGNSSR